MQNAISWFEIPTTDINRAQKFYETIFGISMMPMDLPNIKMRMFPLDDMMTQVGGALVDSGGFHKPSGTDGPLMVMAVVDWATATGTSVVRESGT